MRWRDSDKVSRMKATDSLKLFDETQFLIVYSVLRCSLEESAATIFKTTAGTVHTPDKTVWIWIYMLSCCWCDRQEMCVCISLLFSCGFIKPQFSLFAYSVCYMSVCAFHSTATTTYCAILQHQWSNTKLCCTTWLAVLLLPLHCAG